MIIMTALYKPAFRKFVKKQSRAFQLAIEDEVYAVLETPESGQRKTGDLEGVRVHKFKFHKREYLMAYVIQRTNVLFYMIGVHENFYKDLKGCMKEVV